MAKAESKTILKAYSTVESKLPTLPLEDGQLIFVYDKKKIILDNHGVRTVYEQIQTIETEEQRNDLLAPIDSFYFVIETSILWRYTNGHWIQITTSPQEQIDRIAAEGAKQVKAVQDKGNEVLQSIPEDFQMQMESKLDKQQGVENKGKALVIGEDGNVAPGEVQSGGGDGIAIINTMSGESPLAIPDSAERVNKRLELGGKTEQVSTRGVNLWNKESKITFTATKQVVFDTPIPAGDYVVSANVTSNDKDGAVCLILFYYTDSGSKGANLTRAGRASAKITFTSDVKHVVLYAGSNANGSANDTATFADIQLEKGSTATAYEPYTGGKPSPSPEYQQEIKNSGKWNEETQKYEVTVEKFGKNLFNKSIALPLSSYDVKTGSYWRKYFYLFPNTKYRMRILNNSGNPVQPNSTVFIGPASPEYNYDSGHANGLAVLFPTDAKEKNYIFSTDETGKMVLKAVGYANETNIQENLDNIDIMIYEHSLDDKIEQYIEPKTISLTSDRPITKWDRLVEQGGEIGWLYASKKYVITGNEFFEYRSGYDQDAYTNRFIVINDLFVNRLNDKQLAYCKILKRVQYIYAQNKLEEGIDTNANQLHIKLSNDRIGVLSSDDTETRTAKIAEYIKNTYTDGIEILYATTDTVFLPLPQSEQNAIRALKTYYPTTVITADGGELDPDIKVTYTADTKNYIDNKFGKTINAMQTKLLELESRV